MKKEYLVKLGDFIRNHDDSSPLLAIVDIELERMRVSSKQMPDGYVVVDGDGDHMYSADEKDFCNDHINDCALHESVSKWKIKPFIFLKK